MFYIEMIHHLKLTNIQDKGHRSNFMEQNTHYLDRHIFLRLDQITDQISIKYNNR